MDLRWPGSIQLKGKPAELAIQSGLFLCAITSIIIMLLIFYFLIREGLRAFVEVGIVDLILGQKWHPAGDIYGMMPLIVNSLLVTALALIINISIGIPLSIYLAELAVLRLAAKQETSRADELCEQFQQHTGAGYTRFHEILNKLDAVRLINTDFSGSGARGRSRVIKIRYGPEEILSRIGEQ